MLTYFQKFLADNYVFVEEDRSKHQDYKYDTGKIMCVTQRCLFGKRRHRKFKILLVYSDSYDICQFYLW